MIVVTGGAGFIGANLLAGLEAKGIGPLAVCDRLGDDGKWRNIAKRELADIVPPDQLAAWLGSHGAKLRAIFHLGATSSTTARDGDEVVANNFHFSRKLWRWAAENDTTLIYASSAAVYGDGAAGFDDDPAAEAMARLRPLNLYGWSKLLFDRWVTRTVAMGEPRPPQWAGLRFFNVYGPNEYHKGAQQSVVPQLYEQIGTTGRAASISTGAPGAREAIGTTGRSSSGTAAGATSVSTGSAGAKEAMGTTGRSSSVVTSSDGSPDSSAPTTSTSRSA